MKTVALRSLGCKVNAYETEGMQQILQQNGYLVVPFDTKADIYIVNTCSVTNMADQKSRQMLHRAKKLNPEAVVIACGCYVQTGRAKLELDPSVDIIVGNNEKRNILAVINEYFEGLEKGVSAEELKAMHVQDLSSPTEYEEMQVDVPSDHTRGFVKIQDGCNQFCTYCVIPYARGRIRSRKIEDVVKEVQTLAIGGCKEIVLTGIHISSFGLDRGESELLELVGRLNEIDGIARIRLGSLEPRIITEEFAQGLHSYSKVCPHFHLSMQSGCDAVLKRMNRHYTSDEYFEKVEILRSVFDDPAITTDVIVGFPQESEEEFETTYSFVEKVGFYEIHVFKYSKRDGTIAAKMPGQVPEPVKTARSERLIELGNRLSKEYRARYHGCSTSVLFEEIKNIDGRDYWVGHTPEYILGALKSSSGNGLENTIISGVLSELVSDDVMLLDI